MDPVVVRYPVRITEKNKALEQAAKSGVELGDWFESPLHAAEAPLELYDYTPGCCPIAEKACQQVVNLPTHMRVTEKTARKTVDFITQFTSAE
jgi:dTDP-4-amino-4,6-dideoxygalactose transaminase